jgi:dTMP kinase
MTPETELLLMNASRAQLVREIIRPSLEAGEVVLCDRYLDSSIAYQGCGRGLDLGRVRGIIDFAVGPTLPALTFLLLVPVEISEARRRSRNEARDFGRDRFEEEDRSFFERVEKGYQLLAAAEPGRFRLLDATESVANVEAAIWEHVRAVLPPKPPSTSR